MKRYENQQARPTAGCLSVLLFNQKKRSRLPLTSNPSEKKFCSGNEYMPTHSSASSIINTSGNTGYYQDQAPRCPAPAVQHNQCSRQGNQQSQPQSQCPNSQPVPVPVGRSFAPSHPYHTGNTGLQMGQPPVRQDSRAPTNPRQSNYNAPCSSGNTQSKPVSPSSYSQMGQQQSGYRQRQDNPTTPPLYSQQSKPTPPPSRPSHGPGTQEQNTSWKFITTTNTGPQKQLMEDSRDTYQTQNISQSQVQHVKPATENSLRILTAVIDGIRHWSHFKGRAPYLFEIFATLDSAVTAGSHGAKNFLMRDGKEVVQCVFYENDYLPAATDHQHYKAVVRFSTMMEDMASQIVVYLQLPPLCYLYHVVLDVYPLCLMRLCSIPTRSWSCPG